MSAPLRFLSLTPADLAASSGPIDAAHNLLAEMYDARLTGLVVRGAFPAELLAAGAASLSASTAWTSPNRGMRGGEIRTIGDAATPTFTHLRGPPDEIYAESARAHAERTAAIFGDGGAALAAVQGLLSRLGGGVPAEPPAFDAGHRFAAFNFRALDPGQQIFTHHDHHFGLSVYRHMDADLDRQTLLSFFITLQAPEAGGELLVYGVRGDDPEVPVLPSRFLDTAAIEARYPVERLRLAPGDLVVFDAGRHVHRVAPVEGTRPRLTFGGFLTLSTDRRRVAFWG